MSGGLRIAMWAAARPFRGDAPPLGAVASAAARLAAPVATNRRIAVLSLDGGSGTSVVAAGVSSALGRTRPGAVLAVSAHRSTRGLAWHLGVDEAAQTAAAGNAADVVAARAQTAASACGPLFLPASDGDEESVDVASWWAGIAPITRFFDVTVTDFGRRPAPDQVTWVAERSHALCIVARADRHSAELAALLAERVRISPARAVLCLVDRQGFRFRTARILRVRGTQVVTVPRERSLESEPYATATLHMEALLALDILAGDLLDAARGGRREVRS